MASNEIQADKLDERWEPTSIHATFALLQLPPCNTRSLPISVRLPLLNLGWTFALSLAPERRSGAGKRDKHGKKTHVRWTLGVLSFRQRDSNIPWGNTSMLAELVLHTEQNHISNNLFGPQYEVINTSTSLGQITAVLACTPLTELPPLTTSLTLSSPQRVKFSLTVTVSDCPFPNGLFQAISMRGSETEAQTQLVKQSGNRVLTRSLATGKLFDVKFLSASIRLVSGNTDVFLPTYASLSVLEKYLHLPDSKLEDGWRSALAGLNIHNNPDANPREVSWPVEYEYELDSDYGDEELSSSDMEPGASSLPCEDNPAIFPKGEQPEGGTAGSSSSRTVGGSAQGLADFLLEEVIQGSRVSSPEAAPDGEPTIFIKFAAHRTWHAFLWYCYTGHVEFSRLRSQVEPGARHRCVADDDDGPPSCSPKSMYRLADLIGDKDLKAMALEAIRVRMTKTNVLDEAFSVFTSKYPDVREVQLDVLMDHCGSPEVKKAFLKAMHRYSDMDHAEPVLSAFYDRLVA